MLSAFINSMGSYPAMLLAEQLVYRCHVHPGPLVLRTGPFKLVAPTTDRDQTVSRRFEPSSRTTLIGEQPNPWKVLPSMWTLGSDQPVIPRVAFIRWATIFPRRIAGSLCPTFVPARDVPLAVKHPYAIALEIWFPTILRVPWGASVTFWEATAPVKLPA